MGARSFAPAGASGPHGLTSLIVKLIQQGDGQMRSVSVVNVSTGEILAKQALVAETMFSRFMGLQGKRSLPEGGGLILMPTNAIHTLFMMMTIDAVFVSQTGKVLRIGRRLHPWRLGPIVPYALYCVELPAEKAAATDIGHTIELRPPVDPGAVGGGSGQEGCSIRSI